MNGGAVVLLMAVVGFGSLFVIWLVKTLSRGGGAGARAPQWRPEFGETGTPERPFQPTVAGPGIAIDDAHNWLWLATDENGHKLIDKFDVRGWKHEWKEVNQGGGSLEFWNNALVIRLADLRTPVVRVSFGRDRALAAEWQARLTTWMGG